MSQAQRPLSGPCSNAMGSSPLQQQPFLRSEATTAAPKLKQQDDSNAADESNNASEPKLKMAQVEEAVKPRSEDLRQTFSRLPGTPAEIPTVAFHTILSGIMRRLFKEIEGDSERARVFAQECLSELSPEDLQTIVQFQGQLGSPDKLGGDPPYPVAKNMEISRRYALYEDGHFDREETENAFRRLFQAVEKTGKELHLEELKRYASESMRDMDEDATARTI